MALNPNNSYRTAQTGFSAYGSAALDAGLRAYMLRVYNWMASGLVLTGLVAYAIFAIPALHALFYTTAQNAQGYTVEVPTILSWIAVFAPLAFVMVLSFGVNKLSTQAAQTLFWVFCGAMGASLSTIFMVYTETSIAEVFFITAGTFAATSLYGYTTGKDLTSWGSFFLMGLFGIIIASLVNIFLHSPAVAFAVSILGVFIFVGLTAYDTQRIKADYIQYGSAYGVDMAGKRSVYDALTLYLNFINLFMFLLQLFGQRNQR
ncbi:MAG TPA: Bax inhibitor-1/YccA family protein [Acidocella sp.]|nr:Bax inhibitor-1/YccA family protein [Acidocella sp.]